MFSVKNARVTDASLLAYVSRAATTVSRVASWHGNARVVVWQVVWQP
jgi:hypothetical protein